LNGSFYLLLLLSLLVGSIWVTLTTILAEKFGSKIGGLIGMLSIVVYATSIRYFYPRFGLIVGTVGAYFIALLSAYLSYVFFQRRVD